MGSIVFVLGGVRSGKTSFARKLAEEHELKTGLPVTYLATAEARDEEMHDRIARHRRDRPESWITREEPFDPASVIRTAGGESSAIILDCMTLLVTNLLLRDESLAKEEAERMILDATGKILLASREQPAAVIIISNEAGLGLVSSYDLGRRFQDIAGLVHQKIAAQADEVFFLVAGLPLKLK